MGYRKQMSLSWVNVDWFKRKILHEYQSGGDEATKKYLRVIAQAVTDTDYVELLEYANSLTTKDIKEKTEDDKLWRI